MAPITENKENVEAQENKNLVNGENPIKTEENSVKLTETLSKPIENPSKLLENPSKTTENPAKELANSIKSTENSLKDTEITFKSTELDKIPENVLEKNIIANADIPNDQKPAREREKSKYPVTGYSDEENMW